MKPYPKLNSFGSGVAPNPFNEAPPKVAIYRVALHACLAVLRKIERNELPEYQGVKTAIDMAEKALHNNTEEA